MSEEVSCQTCGAPLPLNAQFCVQCGTRASKNAPAADASAGSPMPGSHIAIDGVLVVS